MFPSLAARETCVAETNFAARKQKMFLPGVKNIFASRTQILRPRHMFPSLATPGNINIALRSKPHGARGICTDIGVDFCSLLPVKRKLLCCPFAGECYIRIQTLDEVCRFRSDVTRSLKLFKQTIV